MQLLPHVSEETRNRRKSFVREGRIHFVCQLWSALLYRRCDCGAGKLFVQTPEAFGKRFNIDVRTRSEVIAIHSADKTVDIRTSDGKTYTESYDKLLLSPGASPVRPPLPGIDNEGILPYVM